MKREHFTFFLQLFVSGIRSTSRYSIDNYSLCAYALADIWVQDIVIRTKDDFRLGHQRSRAKIWTDLANFTQGNQIFYIPRRF